MSECECVMIIQLISIRVVSAVRFLEQASGLACERAMQMGPDVPCVYTFFLLFFSLSGRAAEEKKYRLCRKAETTRKKGAEKGKRKEKIHSSSWRTLAAEP